MNCFPLLFFCLSCNLIASKKILVELFFLRLVVIFFSFSVKRKMIGRIFRLMALFRTHLRKPDAVVVIGKHSQQSSGILSVSD